MTREEEIIQASIKWKKANNPVCMGGDAFSDMMDFFNASQEFIAGAQWADSHPKNPWISVKDRLPDNNCVVFVSLDGTEYLSAHYRAKSKRFVTVSKDKQTLVEVRKSSATYTVCGDCIKEERLYSEGQREDITSLVTHWMSIPN